MSRKLVDIAIQQGWQVQITKKSHLRFIPPDPDQPIVVGSGTPSDPRSDRNLVARLRRAGLAV